MQLVWFANHILGWCYKNSHFLFPNLTRAWCLFTQTHTDSSFLSVRYLSLSYKEPDGWSLLRRREFALSICDHPFLEWSILHNVLWMCQRGFYLFKSMSNDTEMPRQTIFNSALSCFIIFSDIMMLLKKKPNVLKNKCKIEGKQKLPTSQQLAPNP